MEDHKITEVHNKPRIYRILFWIALGIYVVDYIGFILVSLLPDAVAVSFRRIEDLLFLGPPLSFFCAGLALLFYLFERRERPWWVKIIVVIALALALTLAVSALSATLQV